MSKNTIPVLEVFGPTIQGEGMVIGQKTIFVRTAGCDYKCSWCDSAFTWNGSAKHLIRHLSAGELITEIEELALDKGCNHVTISGGNPALIGEGMADLINMLHQLGVKVGLETQGTRWQNWFHGIDDLTISPKPPSSKMATDWDKLDLIINKLDTSCAIAEVPHNFSLKTVVFDDADWEYAKQVHARYPGVQMYVSVGNADVTSLDDIDGLRKGLIDKLGWLFDKIINEPLMNDVRPLPQLHTLVWGNRRGV